MSRRPMPRSPDFSTPESADPELLREAIEAAVPVVREVRDPTPLEVLPANEVDGGPLLLKREDVPPIHAYKWRGACNRIAALGADERSRGIVAASAGNHAQGVALAAARLGIHAKIFMPLSTPRMKQRAVAALGGNHVEIVLEGDQFDAAARAAEACRASEDRVLVHAFDDPLVIAGQGTLGFEAAAQVPEAPAVAFLQIGGGGLAAGTACWLKHAFPGIRIVGVEGVDQASMQAAVARGRPVPLEYVDVFSDGTAVRRTGDWTLAFCRRLIDEFVTVTNEELCGAIRFLWDRRRLITEPAGAMGVAAWLAHRERFGGRPALAVLCGANMDFAQFGWISRHADLAKLQRRFFRFTIREEFGTLHQLLLSIRERANIVEFQYGKVDESVAFPVIGMEAEPGVLGELESGWRALGIEFEDVGGQEDVEFRLVHYRSELFRMPLFVKVEFPERAGALAAFMGRVHAFAGICYFNYAFTGERVGRALLGFEFRGADDRRRFLELLDEGVPGIRSLELLPDAVLARIL